MEYTIPAGILLPKDHFKREDCTKEASFRRENLRRCLEEPTAD